MTKSRVCLKHASASLPCSGRLIFGALLALPRTWLLLRISLSLPQLMFPGGWLPTTHPNPPLDKMIGGMTQF